MPSDDNDSFSSKTALESLRVQYAVPETVLYHAGCMLQLTPSAVLEMPPDVQAGVRQAVAEFISTWLPSLPALLPAKPDQQSSGSPPEPV